MGGIGRQDEKPVFWAIFGQFGEIFGQLPPKSPIFTVFGCVEESIFLDNMACILRDFVSERHELPKFLVAALNFLAAAHFSEGMVPRF